MEIDEWIARKRTQDPAWAAEFDAACEQIREEEEAEDARIAAEVAARLAWWDRLEQMRRKQWRG